MGTEKKNGQPWSAAVSMEAGSIWRSRKFDRASQLGWERDLDSPISSRHQGVLPQAVLSLDHVPSSYEEAEGLWSRASFRFTKTL